MADVQLYIARGCYVLKWTEERKNIYFYFGADSFQFDSVVISYPEQSHKGHATCKHGNHQQ